MFDKTVIILIISVLVLIFSSIVLNFAIKAESIEGSGFLKGMTGITIAGSGVAILWSAYSLANKNDLLPPALSTGKEDLRKNY